MRKFFKSMQENEDGVVALMFALILPVLLFFLALSIDLSRTFATRAKLVSAQDAGAIAQAITPTENQFRRFAPCTTSPSGGCSLQATIGTDNSYANKYLALNLGDSYLGTDVKGKVDFKDDGSTVTADSRDVQVKPFFLPDSDLTGGTVAEVGKGGQTVATPALIGFVIDLSRSMVSKVEKGSGSKRLAVQEGMERFLYALGTGVVPSGTSSSLGLPSPVQSSRYELGKPTFLKTTTATATGLVANSEVAFAMFHRDSGFRNYGTDDAGDGEFWWRWKEGAPEFPGYKDDGHNLQEHDLAGFSPNYESAYNFIVGIGPNNKDGRKNDSYSSITNKVIDTNVGVAGGTCTSCGLYEISNFFAAKDNAINPQGKPYGKVCNKNGMAVDSNDGSISGACSSDNYRRTIVIITDGQPLNFDPTYLQTPLYRNGRNQRYEQANPDASPIEKPSVDDLRNVKDGTQEIYYYKYDVANLSYTNGKLNHFPSRSQAQFQFVDTNTTSTPPNDATASMNNAEEIDYNMANNRAHGLMKRLYGKEVYRFGRYTQYTPMMNPRFIDKDQTDRLNVFYGTNSNKGDSIFDLLTFVNPPNFYYNRGLVNLHETCQVLREAGYKIVTIQVGGKNDKNAALSLRDCSTGDPNADRIDIWDPVSGKVSNEQVYYPAFSDVEIRDAIAKIAVTTTTSKLRVNE